MKLNTPQELIEDIKNGKMVILVDDEDRENEGDLVIGADHITPEVINFMAKEARGLICLALTPKQIDNLGIPLMVKEDINTSPNKTAFTVSIEASNGVSTGISAADRAHTVRVAASPKSTSADITVPGHVFPIRSKVGGVLKRAGHTEGSVDLCALAGLNPAAVICEIMNPDGTMARMPNLTEFAKEHDLKIGTIEDLIQHRIDTESFVEEVASAELKSEIADGFKIKVFRNTLDNREHLALVKGEINSETPTMVRVHAESVLGDVFQSSRFPSGSQLKRAMEKISEFGSGIVVYLRMDDMNQRLSQRVKVLGLEDQDSTVPDSYYQKLKSDKKDYGVGAQILRALGVRKINLLTNNPSKRVGLKGYGLEIIEAEPLFDQDHPSAKELDNEFHSG